MTQRAYERYSPKSTVVVIDQMSARRIGIVINISRGGLMMLSEGESPQPGAIHQVSLIDEEQAGLDITVGIHCLWLDEANASNTYWSGYQIIDISDEDQAQLDAYIKRLE